MNRDIKFRAWDKSNDHMLGPYDLTDSIFNNKVIRSLQLMQYTGLKDKNGIEIYEFDIDKYKGVMMWSKEKALFCLHDFNKILDRWLESSYPANAEIMEVIGNIYQNPELLETVQK